MGIGIFRRSFVVRRFSEQHIVDGYSVAGWEDMIASLNVQPLSKDELQSLPEGQNTVKRMKAFGNLVFNTASQSSGRRGDWLFYQGCMDPEGHWYECVSSLGWDHTMLGHCRSEFVQVSEAEAKRVPRPEILSDGKGGCCL